MRIKLICLTVAVVFLCMGLFAQKSFLVKKPGSTTYFAYSAGDDISLKMAGSNTKIYTSILSVTDSSMVVLGKHELLFEKIENIYRERNMWRIFSVFTRYAGLGYLGLDVVNRTINKDYPIVQESTVWISAGLIASSFAVIPLKNKVIHIGKPWIIVVVDLPDIIR
ncbi:MAG: hypothetical protein KKA81_07785 [Bacteroidetes bacterium]|nr:hypothetical protein [Bacteroidota bacterium]